MIFGKRWGRGVRWAFGIVLANIFFYGATLYSSASWAIPCFGLAASARSPAEGFLESFERNRISRMHFQPPFVLPGTRLRAAVIWVGTVSSGSQAPLEAKREGIYSITVTPPNFTVDGVHGDFHVDGRGKKLEEVMGEILDHARAKGLHLSLLLPVSDPSVDYAGLLYTKLSARLASEASLKKNSEYIPLRGSQADEIHFNKSAFLKAQAEKGFPVAAFTKVKSPKEAVLWAQEKGFFGTDPTKKKLMVKPDNSAGAQGTGFVFSLTELAEKVQSLFGQKNANNRSIDDVVLQSDLGDHEGAVDGVLWTLPNGKKVFVPTEVLAYDEKIRPAPGKPTMYNMIKVADLSGELEQQQIAYARALALTVLPLDFAFLHIEIFTKGSTVSSYSFQSTDVGVRPVGGRIPDGVRMSTGSHNQFSVALQMLKASLSANPADIDDLVVRLPFISTHRSTYLLYLSNFKAWAIVNQQLEAEMKKFAQMVTNQGGEVIFDISVEPGQKIGVSEDLFSRIGAIFVSHRDDLLARRLTNYARDQIPWFETDPTTGLSTGAVVPPGVDVKNMRFYAR